MKTVVQYSNVVHVRIVTDNDNATHTINTLHRLGWVFKSGGPAQTGKGPRVSLTRYEVTADHVVLFGELGEELVEFLEKELNK